MELSSLLQEVLSIYKSLTPEKLTMKDSSKVCDVLVLFEVISAPLISFSSGINFVMYLLYMFDFLIFKLFSYQIYFYLSNLLSIYIKFIFTYAGAIAGTLCT